VLHPSNKSDFAMVLPRPAETLDNTLKREVIPKIVKGEKYEKVVEPVKEEKEYFEKETQMLEGEQVIGVAKYVIRHIIGKKLSAKQIVEVQKFVERLRYPSRKTIFSGGEDYYLYYCPDNLETKMCRYTAKIIGFPKLESGLAVVPHQDLADYLAYTSLKVTFFFVSTRKGQGLRTVIFTIFAICRGLY
jgi:hypothetical protein